MRRSPELGEGQFIFSLLFIYRQKDFRASSSCYANPDFSGLADFRHPDVTLEWGLVPHNFMAASPGHLHNTLMMRKLKSNIGFMFHKSFMIFVYGSPAIIEPTSP